MIIFRDFGKIENLEFYLGFEQKFFLFLGWCSQTDAFRQESSLKTFEKYEFFPTLNEQFIAGLSKQHSTCPEEL